jgi:threonine dehydratase
MSDALGCGSGLSGHCIVAKTLTPAGKVIGVQAEKAPAAAARKLGDRLRGTTVVLIVSGCNITREQLTRVLTDPQPW